MKTTKNRSFTIMNSKPNGKSRMKEMTRRRFLGKTALGAMTVSALGSPWGRLAAAETGAGAALLKLRSADVSDAYYDWTKTLQPERPYIHDYSQTLVMKMGVRGQSAFAQTLDVIKRLDNLTCGIPKILYLVGWQLNGGDSMYPDWSAVNPRLKRPEDATAADSLKRLMAEGFKYNTTVSLHINMMDAYENSPLWSAYLQNNIIAKDKNGDLVKGGVWGGRQSYRISYWQEWNTGYARKRIDALLALLPIQKAGTVHIDAFVSVAPGRENRLITPLQPLSPFLGNTAQDEIATQRKIIRYWRSKGVDVTLETFNFNPDPFIGLAPMRWHFNMGEIIPKNLPHFPASLCCGTPMNAEEEINRDPEHLTGLKEQFCLNVVPWFYENSSAPKGSQQMRDGDDICMPALWRKQVLVAYSQNGYQNKTWQLPPGWEGVTKVQAAEITIDGPTNVEEIPVESGGITLSVRPGQELEIQPAK